MRGPRRRRYELRGPSTRITVEPIELPTLPPPPLIADARAGFPKPGRSCGTSLEEIRVACQQVIDSDGEFAILESLETPYHYVQWIECEGGIHIEIADPTYNDKPPLSEHQLELVAELGFEKGSVNFNRDFAPDEQDAESLSAFVLECFEKVFGVSDVSKLEIAGS